MHRAILYGILLTLTFAFNLEAQTQESEEPMKKVEAIRDNQGAILYWKVRPDYYDSLNVWATLHPLLTKVNETSRWMLSSDSLALTTSRRSNEQLHLMLSQAQQEIDFMNDAMNKKHNSWYIVWEDLKFPVGIVVGACITTTLYHNIK